MRTTVLSRGARTVGRVGALVLFCCAGQAALAASPHSDPIQKTTELGITVEPSHIFDAFEESVDFWPAIRRYMVSDRCEMADREQRVAAAAFVKRVQDDLHGRLFGADEAAAKDVVDYVTWGLRRAKFYRELRSLVGQPRALVALRGEFEGMARDARRNDVVLNVSTTVARMDSAMQPLSLEPEQHARAVELWRNLSECTVKLNATEAMMVIQRADDEAGKIPSGELVRKVAAAADWALIVKTGKRTTREDFIAAWHELHDQPVAAVASAMGQ